MSRRRRRTRVTNQNKYVGENQRFLTNGKPIVNAEPIDKKGSRHFHCDYFIKVVDGKDHWSGSQKKAYQANGHSILVHNRNWGNC